MIIPTPAFPILTVLKSLNVPYGHLRVSQQNVALRVVARITASQFGEMNTPSKDQLQTQRLKEDLFAITSIVSNIQIKCKFVDRRREICRELRIAARTMVRSFSSRRVNGERRLGATHGSLPSAAEAAHHRGGIERGGGGSVVAAVVVPGADKSAFRGAGDDCGVDRFCLVACLCLGALCARDGCRPREAARQAARKRRDNDNGQEMPSPAVLASTVAAANVAPMWKCRLRPAPLFCSASFAVVLSTDPKGLQFCPAPKRGPRERGLLKRTGGARSRVSGGGEVLPREPPAQRAAANLTEWLHFVDQAHAENGCSWRCE